jgi:hypothetical protein
MSEKPTAGPWKYEARETVPGSPHTTSGIIYSESTKHYVADVFGYGSQTTPYNANGRLIADAGTIYHETGLTPRELLTEKLAETESYREGERRMMADYDALAKEKDKLLAAVKEYIAARADSRGGASDTIRVMDAKENLLAAIAKVEGK